MRQIAIRAAFAALALTLSAGARAGVVYGDANGDGKVNVQDATLTLRAAIGLTTLTADQIAALDVAPVSADGTFGDGKVNVADASRILQRAIGIGSDSTWPGQRSIHAPASTGIALPTTLNYSVHGDANQNIPLQSGHLLKGTLTGTKDSLVTTESIYLIDESTNAIATVGVNSDGSYQVGLPSGTYRVFYDVTATPSVTLPTGGSTGSTGGDTGGTVCIPYVPGISPVPGIPFCTDTTGSTGGDTGGTTTGGSSTTGSTGGDIGGTTTGGSSTTGSTGGDTGGTTTGGSSTTGSTGGDIGGTTTGGSSTTGSTGGDIGGTTTGGSSMTGSTGGDSIKGSIPLQTVPLASSTLLRFSLDKTIAVSGDMTQDIARPALPKLFAIQGKVSSADSSLQPPYTLDIQMIKDANGSPLNDATSVTTSAISTDGSYSASLPVGEYAATARELAASTLGSPALTASPNIKVNGPLNAQNLTIAPPAIVTLSGSVTQASAPANSWIVYAALTNPVANGIQSNFAQVQNGLYSLNLTAGAYYVSLSRSTDETSDNAPTWSYLAGTVNVAASMTYPIQIPALPTGTAKVKGEVLGPDGAVITKGDVFFISRKLDNADANLSYNVTVPIGDAGTFAATLPLGEYSAHVVPDLGIDLADIESSAYGSLSASQ